MYLLTIQCNQLQSQVDGYDGDATAKVIEWLKFQARHWKRKYNKEHSLTFELQTATAADNGRPPSTTTPSDRPTSSHAESLEMKVSGMPETSETTKPPIKKKISGKFFCLQLFILYQKPVLCLIKNCLKY